jgi:hypothetical protein
MNEHTRTEVVEVSYLPIDCGFDLRKHKEMQIKLPPGSLFKVQYMHFEQERVVEGDRKFVVSTLREEGYQVADFMCDEPITFNVADMGSTDKKVTRPLCVQLDRGGHVAAMHSDVQGVAYDDLADLADDYAMDLDELLRRAAAAIGTACALQWDATYVAEQLADGNQPIPSASDIAFLWELLSVAYTRPVAPGVDAAPLDVAIRESFHRAFGDQITKLAESVAPAA